MDINGNSVQQEQNKQSNQYVDPVQAAQSMGQAMNDHMGASDTRTYQYQNDNWQEDMGQSNYTQMNSGFQNANQPNFSSQSNDSQQSNYWGNFRQSNYNFQPSRSKPGVSPERFEIFGGFAFGYAMIYSVLMYRNYASICTVFMAVMTVLFMSISIVRHEKNLPKNMEAMLSYGKLLGRQAKLIPHYIGILLLGISVCRTDDSFLIFMDHFGILFLVCAGLLRYFENTREIGFIEYGLNVIEKMLEPLTCFDRFFSDYRQYNAEHQNAKKHAKFVYILIGLVVAIPLLFVMITLLASADQIFGDAVQTILGNIFLSWDVVWFLVFAFVVLLFTYGIIVAAPFGSRHNRQRKAGTHEPIIAITAMGLLTLVYLLFSVIQILYLFTNNMSLPDDMTYADYARQGFFQLMFVSVLNVILVLICHAMFRKSMVLNIVLTVMSACTYVMIASSALRMSMYIEAYDLTYMRILVFAALAILAVVLVGVIIRIYTERFPLVRFSIFVIVGVYILVSFIRPAYLVARYNLENQDPKDVDFWYVTSLGADGAEEVYRFIADNYPLDPDYNTYTSYYDNMDQYDKNNDYYYNSYKEYNDIEGFSYNRMKSYFKDIQKKYEEKGAIRGFNFSRYKAEKYAERFFERWPEKD